MLKVHFVVLFCGVLAFCLTLQAMCAVAQDVDGSYSVHLSHTDFPFAIKLENRNQCLNCGYFATPEEGSGQSF